jgi:hypothetical protein
MANDIHQATPLKSGKTPIELFTGSAPTVEPRFFHPFGCPVYVLSARMQQDGKGSEWEERARVGIHLGKSPVHARSVSLVLNLETGLVSPQFHVKFDDLFDETASSSKDNIKWASRTGFIPSDEPESTEPPTPDVINLPPTTTNNEEQTNVQDTIETDDQSTETVRTSNVSIQPVLPVSEGVSLPDNESGSEPQPSTIDSTQQQVESQASPDSEPSVPTVQQRTRTRIIRPPECYRLEVAFIAQAWDDMWDIKDYEIQEAMTDPIAFAAHTNPDTMYLHEALRAPDRADFIRAMQEEVKAHATKPLPFPLFSKFRSLIMGW